MLWFEIFQIPDTPIYPYCRQGLGLAGKLFQSLFPVVGIYMYVSKSMDKFSRFVAGQARDNVSEKCVTGNVERHTKENVRGPLVKLARKLSVLNVELEHVVTDGKTRSLFWFCHLV